MELSGAATKINFQYLEVHIVLNGHSILNGHILNGHVLNGHILTGCSDSEETQKRIGMSGKW